MAIRLLLMFIIFILAYTVLMRVFKAKANNKGERFSQLLRNSKEKEYSFLSQWLEKKGMRTFVSPSCIREEAQKYGVNISKQSFCATFMTGAVVSTIIMFVYFRPLLALLPFMVAIGGYIGVHVRLHDSKKKYMQRLDDKIAMYMSTLATAMGTFGNIKQAFASTVPLLDYPIKPDVEKAMMRLQDGKSIKDAFSEMNEKYKVKHLRLFHDQLDVLVKGGSSDVTFLRNIAFKMKQKAVYRRKLQTAHRQQFKVWRAFVVLSLSAPFLFMFVSMDNYKLVMNQLVSSVVFAITFALILLTYRQLEKLEIYDPTHTHEQN